MNLEWLNHGLNLRIQQLMECSGWFIKEQTKVFWLATWMNKCFVGEPCVVESWIHGFTLDWVWTLVVENWICLKNTRTRILMKDTLCLLIQIISCCLCGPMENLMSFPSGFFWDFVCTEHEQQGDCFEWVKELTLAVWLWKELQETSWRN